MTSWRSRHGRLEEQAARGAGSSIVCVESYIKGIKGIKGTSVNINVNVIANIIVNIIVNTS